MTYRERLLHDQREVEGHFEPRQLSKPQEHRVVRRPLEHQAQHDLCTVVDEWRQLKRCSTNTWNLPPKNSANKKEQYHRIKLRTQFCLFTYPIKIDYVDHKMDEQLYKFSEQNINFVNKH